MWLERAGGGTLEDADLDDAAKVAVLGSLARRLHRVPAVEHPRLAPFGSSVFVRRWRRCLAGSPYVAELDDLLRTSARSVLHVDLHTRNVLGRRGGGWLAIDPTPYAGDPHADVWGLLHCDPFAFPRGRQVRALVDVYAKAAGLDRLRVARWLMLQAAAVSVECEQADPERARRMTALAQLLCA